jgi:DNA-binding transcriptional ArsR family regulator
MTAENPAPDPTTVFRALSDPVRWSIVSMVMAAPEVARADIEKALPISRPTVTFHVRTLTYAGLIDVVKRGRNHYYRLNLEVLETALMGVEGLVSESAAARVA